MALFVVVHLAAPLVIGERYPFTVSPMFCDQPTHCCTYSVADADGNPLDAGLFNLHLVYDGNPPGLGMGIVPTKTLHPFGESVDEEVIIRHVQQRLNQINGPDQVVVTRRHLEVQNHQVVEQLESWTIDREGQSSVKRTMVEQGDPEESEQGSE